MKRAFEKKRVSFWIKVQQVAERALKLEPDVSFNHQKYAKNDFLEEKFQSENTAASEGTIICNISFGSNPEQSPQIKAPIKHEIKNCSSPENVKSSSESKNSSKEKEFLEENILNPVQRADNCILNSPEELKTYPVLFFWIKGGKEVYLTGDFSRWRPIMMAKVDRVVFSLCLYLPEGNYAYNFIVDDVMRHDEGMPNFFGFGKLRNKIGVKREVYEESKVLSADLVDVGDTRTHMISRGSPMKIWMPLEIPLQQSASTPLSERAGQETWKQLHPVSVDQPIVNKKKKNKKPFRDSL